ncbi:MAG: hypothetical protein V3W44_10790 [Dehalococcoidales bacterium]
MSDYTDAAPNVSKIVGVSAFKADFPKPAPPAPPVPEPNSAKKTALYEAYVAEYNSNNGAVALSRLARTMQVPRNWCVILDREIRAAIAAVHAGE